MACRGSFIGRYSVIGEAVWNLDVFDTSGTDDKEIRSRVIQARKCIACLNGILWSEDIRKERKLNIYNALIKSS
jgi:hypothetical protein